jgi:hypothetical protein
VSKLNCSVRKLCAFAVTSMVNVSPLRKTCLENRPNSEQKTRR